MKSSLVEIIKEQEVKVNDIHQQSTNKLVNTNLPYTRNWNNV